MASSKELLQTLKSELRSQQITYATISKQLDVSESTIKRLFSRKDMSLSRLENICEIAHIDILQLATKAVEQRRHVRHLKREYEQEIVANEKLLLITVHLVHGWEYNKILAEYKLDLFEGQHLLTRLDNMRIIELLPHNKVRVLLSPDFKWIKNGPIENFFESNIQNAFFQSGFNKQGELRLVANGWMSLESIQLFHEKMLRLTKEFELQLGSDKHIPVERRKGTTLVVAIRPWTLAIFEAYRNRSSVESV